MSLFNLKGETAVVLGGTGELGELRQRHWREPGPGSPFGKEPESGERPCGRDRKEGRQGDFYPGGCFG
jgi:hypothetical protein